MNPLATFSVIFSLFALNLLLPLNPVMAHGLGLCRPESVRLETSDKKFYVDVVRYRSTSPSGGLVIMPPTGGVNFLDRTYAQNFCDKGIDAWIVKSWTGSDEAVGLDLNVHARLLESSLFAIEKVISEMPFPKVSILGSSLGALYSIAALATFDKIKDGFLIAGGFPFSKVIARSKLKELSKVRRNRIAHFGFKSSDAYLEELANVLKPIEDKVLNTDFQSKRIGIIYSGSDDVVPTSLQKKFNQISHPDFLFRSRVSHKWTLIWSASIWMHHIESFLLESDPSSDWQQDLLK